MALADGNHTVRFTVNSLIAADEYFGGLPEMFEAMKTHRLRSARALLFLAGVAPSLEAAGDLMEGVALGDVLTAEAEALSDALQPLRGPDAPDEAAGPTTELVPTNGASSSPSA